MNSILPQNRIVKLKAIKRRLRLNNRQLVEAIHKQTGRWIPETTLWNYLNKKWPPQIPDHIIAIDRFVILNTETKKQESK